MTWWVEWASCCGMGILPVTIFGADCPNTGYRENEGESVPKAPLATTDR
ncbi:MAG: hypothetical protein F6K50_46475 [Moorea sp. SIO3I7]|nr:MULTISPECIES: hypothetical protein [unclassified Moorena]NEO02533.1 hypothetical protein [Moorena sp. SIO3I7]NEO38705.1 hypothetical protein [Moorena sp. SIOASIH]NEO05450.1 hypothetical protein [Moorena sp. SIO3I8]NEO19440.1 hypothetical protein [Moorena sp. SIO4A5]NEP21324.1 hypothetical protein [Moorena sp. SIO3I6]